MRVENVVALQLQEAVGQLALARTDYLGDQHLVIVVGDPVRHAAEVLESPFVELPEALRARPLVRLHEESIRVGQAHHQEDDLALLTALADLRMAYVDLSLARPMG